MARCRAPPSSTIMQVRVILAVAHMRLRGAKDWLASTRTSLIAWWLPLAAMIAGLFVSVPVRTMIWTAALAWMGTACVLNARQCGRTHCRYTGPYYFAMIIPIVAAAITPLSLYGWAALWIFIITGSGIIWWATERAWGKFSMPSQC